jgi:hypothetical protein
MQDRRIAPRIRVEWPCSLRRRVGGPIAARTVDLGSVGMCVLTTRPLTEDEVLEFELTQQAISGKARVMRHEGHGTYALRFESLPGSALDELATLGVGRA